MDPREIEEARKKIIHLFNVYRNGMVADNLKQSGFPYKLIFGLQIPQLNLISKEFPKDLELALSLWESNHIREARLLAAYLFPPESISKKEAVKLIENLLTREEAEILVFKLLRNTPFARELLNLSSSYLENSLISYCFSLLERHLAISAEN